MVNAKDINYSYVHSSIYYLPMFKMAIIHFGMQNYFMEYVVNYNYLESCYYNNSFDYEFARKVWNIYHEYLLTKFEYIFDDFNLIESTKNFLKSGLKLDDWLKKDNHLLNIVGFNFEEEKKRWIQFLELNSNSWL